VACTIMVADCLPILFYSPSKKVVAAAHAGWRGLAGVSGQGGVLDATRRALRSWCSAWATASPRSPWPPPCGTGAARAATRRRRCSRTRRTGGPRSARCSPRTASILQSMRASSRQQSMAAARMPTTAARLK
jgi:hypothetical protein